MPQLLLELFCEEIPARMQTRAASDLARLLGDGLTGAGFEIGDVETFAGPRRLVAVIEDLPARSPDVREERKGPRVDAPEKAIAGFLRGAGLDSVEACETRSDKKGAFYVAVIERPGRAAGDVIAELVPELIKGFPWPKSMRWGAGGVRWVRPLQRIVCVFDGAVVPFEVAGIASGNETEGHRLMGRGPFSVKDFASYRSALETKGFVRLAHEDRAALIDKNAKSLCENEGLELVEDKGLLAEVAGLAEWPVVLMGEMDPAFLDLPPEVIRLSMRTHQKYFAVRDPKTGGLAPRFIVVANQEAPDGGKAIAAGNARVLSARLNDARFFWDADKRQPLGENVEKLKDIVFFKGTSVDLKARRISELAPRIVEFAGYGRPVARLCALAARLAKADLVSEMVYEFPELQGVMGRYYARLEAGLPALQPANKAILKSARLTKKGDPNGEEIDGVSSLSDLTSIQSDAVAEAIKDHYQPLGPANPVPVAPVSLCLAIADKLDTLVLFWEHGEKPTGSGDPYALRRAALGIIRICLENEVSLPLKVAIDEAKWASQYADDDGTSFGDDKAADLLAFFAERLKVHLRDEGHRHDLVDAVFALGEDDLVLIVKRVEALGAFLATDDGANLLAGYKRAANILKAEEKKDGARYAGAPDVALFQQDEEKNLHAALETAVAKAGDFASQENFAGAMSALAAVREPVDGFFDAVTVNADQPALRQNRLLLLSQIRDGLAAVADFSRIEG